MADIPWAGQVSYRAGRSFVLAFSRAEADTEGITARSVAFICDVIAGSAPALTQKGEGSRP